MQNKERLKKTIPQKKRLPAEHHADFIVCLDLEVNYFWTAMRGNRDILPKEGGYYLFCEVYVKDVDLFYQDNDLLR